MELHIKNEKTHHCKLVEWDSVSVLGCTPTRENVTEMDFDLAQHDSSIRAKVLEEVEQAMYHQCFVADNPEDMQKWESGNWFRYKLFENVMDKLRAYNSTDTN